MKNTIPNRLFTINQPEPVYTDEQQIMWQHIQDCQNKSYKNMDRTFKLNRYQDMLKNNSDFQQLVNILRLVDITESLSSYDILCHHGFLKVYLELGGQFIEPAEILKGEINVKEKFIERFRTQMGENAAAEMWYYLGSVSLKNDVGTTKGGCELRNVICIKTARFINNREPVAIHGDLAVTIDGREYGIEHKGNQCRFGGQKIDWDIKAFEAMGNTWRKRVNLVPRVHPFKNMVDWTELNSLLWQHNQLEAAWCDLIHALFPTADWDWVQSQAKYLYDLVNRTPKWYLLESKIAQRAGKRNGQSYKKGDTLSVYKRTDPLLVYAKIPMAFLGAMQGYFYQSAEQFDYIWFELDGKYYCLNWRDENGNTLDPQDIHKQIFGKLIACAGFTGDSREKSVQFQIVPQEN